VAEVSGIFALRARADHAQHPVAVRAAGTPPWSGCGPGRGGAGPTPSAPRRDHQAGPGGVLASAAPRAQRRDRNRPGVVRIVLVHRAISEQPHPGAKLGLHIQHPPMASGRSGYFWRLLDCPISRPTVARPYAALKAIVRVIHPALLSRFVTGCRPAFFGRSQSSVQSAIRGGPIRCVRLVDETQRFTGQMDGELA
jgi:hypothetical protein